MLKVNVGLSRKFTQDFNSSGFSLNLEGEIGIPLDESDRIVEKIKEFYDLAEESLTLQIERVQSESAIASRDEVVTTHRQTSLPPQQTGSRIPDTNRGQQQSNGQSAQNREFTPATNKQIQFLLSLGQRQGMNKSQLEQHVAAIIGHEVGIYDLSKSDAGRILDQLSQNGKKSRTR